MLTVLQLGYLAFFLLTVLVGLAPNVPASERTDTLLMKRFVTLGVLHMSFIAVAGCITLFYIYLIIKESRLTESSRPVWILIIIFGSAFGELAYWYAYVWRKGGEDAGALRTGPPPAGDA
ncbi:MAG: hypothetical protein ACM3JH_07080 [Acidithiobacillales bacterium]